MKINGFTFLTNEEISARVKELRKSGASQSEVDAKIEKMLVGTWQEIGLAPEERRRRFHTHLRVLDHALSGKAPRE